MKTLAIDSGADTGLALFDDYALVACALDDGMRPRIVHEWLPERLEPGERFSVVIETPVVYPHGKADANDLITQAYTGGVVAGVILALRGFTPMRIDPADWKGQRPKDSCGDQIKGALDARELVLLHAAAKGKKLHNVTDAVGIGLWAVGRVDRAGNRLADSKGVLTIDASIGNARRMSIFPR